MTVPSAWGVNNVPSPFRVFELVLPLTELELVLMAAGVFPVLTLLDDTIVVDGRVVLEGSLAAAWTLVLEASKVLSVEVMGCEEATADENPKGTGLGLVIIGVLATTTTGSPVMVVSVL